MNENQHKTADVPHVQKGQAITAEAWNQIVDYVNGSPNVSIVRTRKSAIKGEEQYVCSDVQVVSGGLKFIFDKVLVVKAAREQ